MVKPGCLRNVLRSAREREGCQVMLLKSCEYAFWRALVRTWWDGGVWRGTHVAIMPKF